MRGFIINIRKAKNEDVIVTVLSNDAIKTYWRFFGARHSILQIGHLIDFEVNESKKNFMPNMRSLSHISFPWVFSKSRLQIWQNFIKLFEAHFQDREELDHFYFDLLLKTAQKLEKQNPKRLAVEAYMQLLTHENRLYESELCYICETFLEENIKLMRAFRPTHANCIEGSKFGKKEIFQLYKSKSTIYIEDSVINELYKILLKGF